MRASAPSNGGTRDARATSMLCHSTLGGDHSGIRRAMPSTDSTSGSSISALMTLVPTLPVAPVTTIRMPSRLPGFAAGHARARFCGTAKDVV